MRFIDMILRIPYTLARQAYIETKKDGGLREVRYKCHGGEEVYTIDQQGKKQGEYTFSRRNKRIEIKCTYKDDKKNGVYEEYFQNGNLACRYTYKNGKLSDLFEKYYENGQIKCKCSYRNDQLEGLYKSYYQDGQLCEEYTYKAGEKNGPYSSYFENGQLSEKCTYKDGRMEGLYESYYPNGKLKVRFTCKDSLKDGLYQRYYENGEVASKIVYRNGVKLKGEQAEAYLQILDGTREKPEDIVERVNQEMNWPPIGLARTLERQLEAERIIKNRRMKSVLSHIAQRAKAEGDKPRFDEIVALCPPHIKEYNEIKEAFRAKWKRSQANRE